MSETNPIETNKRYSGIAKLLHWGFVILFLYGIAKQLDEINELEDINLLKFEVLFAAVFLILLIFRFIYMKRTQVSSLPEKTSKIQSLAAKSVHYAMYICLAAIALTGLMIGFLYWLNKLRPLLTMRNTPISLAKFLSSIASCWVVLLYAWSLRNCNTSLLTSMLSFFLV
jgi:cytochrome b561